MRLGLDFYVEELPDYGLETFIETWADAGIDRLRPTFAYHPARIFSPANPHRRLLDLEGDRCFASAEHESAFTGPVRPVFTERSAGVLDRLAAAAGERGIPLDGWTVFLNNRTLALRHPDVAIQSALGCPDCTWLSPSHPATTEYVVGLVRTAGRLGYFEELQVEGLYHLIYSYHPQEVVLGVDLSPLDRWCIGVCVSEHSRRLVDESGGDGERAARSLAAHLERRIAGDGPALPLERDALAEVLGEDAVPLLLSRQLAVTRLADAAEAEARRHGLKLEWEDDVPSWESFFTAEMAGPLSGERQWEFGIDRGAVAASLDGYMMLLYIRDRARMEAEIRSCAEEIGSVPRVGVRPVPPDCRSASELAQTLSLFRDLDVPQVMLYMQSLMSAATPGLVREAASAVRGSR